MEGDYSTETYLNIISYQQPYYKYIFTAIALQFYCSQQAFLCYNEISYEKSTETESD